MSEALAGHCDDDSFDESVWATHADALLLEMDATTAEVFAANVRRGEFAVLLGLAKVYRKTRTPAGRKKSIEAIMSLCAVVTKLTKALYAAEYSARYGLFFSELKTAVALTKPVVSPTVVTEQVVPEGYKKLAQQSADVLSDLVVDACGSPSPGDVDDAQVLELYAVVLLGQVAASLFHAAQHDWNNRAESRGNEDEGAWHLAWWQLGADKVLVNNPQIVRGLLSRLDSDAAEMVLAAVTALVTLHALAVVTGKHQERSGKGGREKDDRVGEGEDGGWFWHQARRHSNLRFLGETVLQLLNRCESAVETRRLLLMTVSLLEQGSEVLYSNDIRVLVDICARGILEERGCGDQDEGERDTCGVLYVSVLEQVVLRHECASDRDMCRKIAGVLTGIMDSGAAPLAAREAQRLLSTQRVLSTHAALRLTREAL